MIKLLVVDDEKSITSSLKTFFTARGFSVFTADSGEKALTVFKKEHPKIVFMDIQMKGTGGIKALEEIKAIDKTTKVIMISVSDDEETIQKAKLMGCDAYIVKPFSMNYLETVVTEKVQEILSRPTIMVVDDEEEARLNIKNYLKERIDAVYVEAEDGEVAINKLKTSPCSIMILDIKMPKKSGLQVIEEAHQINPHIDILVVTAYQSDDVATQSIKKGAVDYLPKPLELKALEAKVNTIIKRKGF